MSLETLRSITRAWNELAPRLDAMTAAEMVALKATHRATILDPESDRVSVLTSRFILGGIEITEAAHES